MISSALQDFELVEEMQHFNEGNHLESYKFLGNKKVEGGVRFSVWAPNASKVSLIGDFNDWNEEEMEAVFETGAWTLVSQTAVEGNCYKYRVYDQFGNSKDKIDPYASKFETPPNDSSIVKQFDEFAWEDAKWLQNRKKGSHFQRPVNIYEVHTTSWMMHPDGRYYTFYELADRLIPYVNEMNYTHIEFMPVMEHPLEASWGYQITGYYAVAAKFGDLDGLAHFINKAHIAGIGVIIDWVPGHFCKNDYALSYFDGTPTYEYGEHWKADNVGWGTLNFDLGKKQVQSFLISNAMFWLKELHADGIRVDAISNMLYLDYSGGEWVPNEDGSNHKREGIEFLQKLNTSVGANFEDVMMIAEESTAWAGVTGTVDTGSLGFHYKWNMGWMNDTLKYFEMDSWHRNDHFNLINFNFVYMQSENYILPLSHDEVVHGKHSLLGRLDGDRHQQFEQLRLLQGYMMGMPGKKLNFMGNEIGQFLEWRFYQELEWGVLNLPYNKEYQHFISHLNYIYKEHSALHYNDYEDGGIEVLEGDAPLVVLQRNGKTEKDFLLCVYNFSHEELHDVPVGVPQRGNYEVILNSSLQEFGGSWEFEQPVLKSEQRELHNREEVINLVVPAMSVLIIKPKRLLRKRGVK